MLILRPLQNYVSSKKVYLYSYNILETPSVPKDTPSSK